MVKSRFTKYGTLVLCKAVREYLEVCEGDFFCFSIDANETDGGRTLYFLRTNDRVGAVTVEKKDRQIYIRLYKCLKWIKIDPPCACNVTRFKYDNQEGFKVEFLNKDI